MSKHSFKHNFNNQSKLRSVQNFSKKKNNRLPTALFAKNPQSIQKRILRVSSCDARPDKSLREFAVYGLGRRD